MNFLRPIGNSRAVPRICLLTETYHPLIGGGETQARILADSLAANGIDAFIMTRRVSRSLRKAEVIDGIAVQRIPPVGMGPLKRWGMLLSALAALGRMRRHYDIVYVSGYKALGISAVLISKLLGKVCILKADSNGEMSGAFFAGGLRRLKLTPSSLIVRPFLAIRNNILRKADLFVAITTDISEELESHGVKRDRICSITNSVDTRRFRPVDRVEKRRLRQRLNVPNKQILVTYSGRLVSYKGLPLLIRVVDRIHQENAAVGFVFVGTGGIDIHNCEKELKEYVRSSRLEDVVHFTGAVSNVHEYLQASDVFVSPTEKDAFPLSIVEAMACGLTVISTRVGGIREIITDGQNGVLIDARDAQQLYDAIRIAIADPARAACIGRAAAEMVQQKYSAEVVGAKYLQLFRQVANLQRSRMTPRTC
jgi:glycosyltransferase involved in cell wall biosynthesis